MQTLDALNKQGDEILKDEHTIIEYMSQNRLAIIYIIHQSYNTK